MTVINYRIAKSCDAKKITDLHFKVRDTYSVGYFSRMNKWFIKKYYDIILSDPYEVVVCAENENGGIEGFMSASLDVNEQFRRMGKLRYKLALGIRAIPSFICHPSLIKETLNRYNSTRGKYNGPDNYIPEGGARLEYWTWDADLKDSISAMELYNKFLLILYALGVKTIEGEIDNVNKKVLKFTLLNKAKVTKEIEMSDGRHRMIIVYDLEEKFKTVNI